MIRRALILFCLCGLVPPVHARPAGPTELARGIDAIVDAPRFSRARWGIAVVSLDSGRSLYAHDAGRLLVDLPGHMGRYRVQLDRGAHPWLADWYKFEWSLIGNLGVDLLIEPLAPLIGLEPAVKLIVMAIPALTAAGLYELKDVDTKVVGWGQLGVGTLVSFVVAFASIAWLLRFVRNHPITVFVSYRVVLGVALIVALGAGWLSAT